MQQQQSQGRYFSCCSCLAWKPAQRERIEHLGRVFWRRALKGRGDEGKLKLWRINAALSATAYRMMDFLCTLVRHWLWGQHGWGTDRPAREGPTARWPALPIFYGSRVPASSFSSSYFRLRILLPNLRVVGLLPWEKIFTPPSLSLSLSLLQASWRRWGTQTDRQTETPFAIAR